MRYLLVLPLVVLFLTGCAKSDRETFNGTWSIYEMNGPDGKKMYSAEKDEQKKLTEQAVKEQTAMYAGSGIGVDEKTIRKSVEQQMEMFGQMTFTFNEKGIVKIETKGDNKAPAVESKFTVDEKTKEIKIEGEIGEKYKYTINDDKITLKGKSGNFTLIKK